MSDPDALETGLDDLDAQIGLDRLRVLHVNDSQTALGSNRDRHELVGKGLIGDGLATFLGHPAFAGLPAITETWEDKGEATEDLDRMRALRRRGRRRWSAAAGGSATVAKTRKVARSRGNSWNSGTRHPRSSSRCGYVPTTSTSHMGSGARRARTAPKPPRPDSASSSNARSISTS